MILHNRTNIRQLFEILGNSIRFVVDSFTLNMNTMFGDPTTFVMNTDASDDATFTSLSTGGVVSYDGSNYVIDRTNANYTTATKLSLIHI